MAKEVVCLVGMGGGGTWNMLDRYPDRFTAAVPIAAVSPSFTFDAGKLVDQSVWAFHARDDGVVSKERSREVVNEILAAAGEPTLTFPSDFDPETFQFIDDMPDLRYTEWPRRGHGIWGRVYNTPEMYAWLFARAVGSKPSTIVVQEPDAIYTAIDDELFDDLGDGTGDRMLKPRVGVGELDTESSNSVTRLVAKFALPQAPEDNPVLQSAKLWFFLEGIGGTPAGPVSLLHSARDNDLDQQASD